MATAVLDLGWQQQCWIWDDNSSVGFGMATAVLDLGWQQQCWIWDGNSSVGFGIADLALEAECWNIVLNHRHHELQLTDVYHACTK